MLSKYNFAWEGRALRLHWKEKKVAGSEEELFWQMLTMTRFESYLQSTPQGDFMIHCLEGESIEKIFQGLREAIVKKNPIALELQKFYLEVLGKDYSLKESEPQIECLSTLAIPGAPEKLVRRVFFFPIIEEKVEAHRAFRKDGMGKNLSRNEALMRAFGTFASTIWLQQDETGYFVIQDSERARVLPSSKERLELGNNAPHEWQEISATLVDHTGLPYDQLSPYVECLTQG